MPRPGRDRFSLRPRPKARSAPRVEDSSAVHERDAGPRTVSLDKGAVRRDAARGGKVQRPMPGGPGTSDADPRATGAGDGERRVRPDRHVEGRRSVDRGARGRGRAGAGRLGRGAGPSDPQLGFPAAATPDREEQEGCRPVGRWRGRIGHKGSCFRGWGRALARPASLVKPGSRAATWRCGRLALRSRPARRGGRRRGLPASRPSPAS